MIASNETRTHLPDPDQLCNRSAEAAVLGSMIIDHEVIPAVLELVTGESFYLPEHKAIFEAILRVRAKSARGVVDGVLLRSDLEAHKEIEALGGLDYLKKVVDSVPSSASAIYYAKLVAEKVLYRKAVAAHEYMGKILAKGGDPAEQVAEIQQAVAALQPERMEKHLSRASEHASEAALDVLNPQTGYITGYDALDTLLGHVSPGDLVVLAGRPSIGKTALGLGMALNLAQAGHRVLWCSLEMLAVKMWQRLTIMRSGVTVRELRNPFCSEDRRNSWFAAALTVEKLPLSIFTGPLTPEKLVDLIRAERQAAGIEVVFVDHLGLMQPGCKTNTRNDEVSAISRGLKAAAMQQCVPVFALCQLNRQVEQRENHRPRMSDLRDSGGVEQDADAVILIHREDYYRKQANPDTTEIDGLAEVFVTKSRNGPTGTCKLVFIEERMQFMPLAVGVPEEMQ
jgi:replicative DNA helicase